MISDSVDVFLRFLVPGLLIVSSAGCAYRLPQMRPASQERIRTITATTGQYTFRDEVVGRRLRRRGHGERFRGASAAWRRRAAG